jgi:hypothetical protein
MKLMVFLMEFQLVLLSLLVLDYFVVLLLGLVELTETVYELVELYELA